MANVSVSSIANDINVSSTLSNISVSDDSGQFLVNVTSTASAITVNPVNTIVEVAASAIVSNQAIRAAIDVANVSGYGNISYDSNIDTSDGIIRYVGVSSSDIRSELSANTSNGITYSDATGIIDQNLNTDLVTQGTFNRYFTTTGAAINTTALNEGTNLYYTDARADARIAAATTDDLAEGTTNLYLNGAGTTANLAEGTNLYFTEARAISAITDATIAPGNVTLKEFKETIVDNGAATSGALTLDMSLGSLHLVAINGDITGITLSNMDEGATATIVFEQDVFGGRTINTASGFGAWNFMGGVTDLGPIGASRSVLVVTLADGVYQASISSPDAATTDDLAEGSTNLYYTNSRSRSAVSTTNASASGGGALAYNSGTGVFTFTPPDMSTAGLTNAQVQTYIQDNGLDVSANIILNGAQDDNGGMVVFTRDSWGTGYNNAHIIKQGTSSDLKFTSDAGYTFVIDYGDDTTGDSFKIKSSHDNIPAAFEVFEQGNIALDLKSTGAVADDAVFKIMRIGVDKLTVNNQGNLTTSGIITAGTNATDTHTFTGNTTITGNLTVGGNIDYVQSQDLLVKDQSISLNVGNVAQDAMIIVDRTGSGAGANTEVRWNETTDKWQFTNDGSTYNDIASTTDTLNLTLDNLTVTNANVQIGQRRFEVENGATSRFGGNIEIGANVDMSGDQEFKALSTHMKVNDISLRYIQDHNDNGSNIMIRFFNDEIVLKKLTKAEANIDITGSNYFLNGNVVGTVSNISNHTTSDLAEGTNLYYTDGRFDTRLGTKSTSDLTEGTNLYYTDGRFDTRLATKSTSDLTEGTNLYYTDARVDAHLTGGTGIDYTAGTIDLADTAVTPGTYGDASNIPQLIVDQQGRITGVSDIAVSIPPSYGNVEVADFLANGFGSNTITTTGNITAAYFIGDGSLLTNISGANVSTVDESKTVVKTVIAGEDLVKGDAVYISGGTGDNPEVSKADADDAAKMPVFGVTTEAVTATNTTDIVIYGLLESYDTTGFATGDSLFVSTTAGALTTTKPTGESALLQTVGKVIKGNSAGGKITITGAGRINATPNLNDGNIFIGNGSNQSVSAVLDTSIVPENTNLYFSNARVDSYLLDGEATVIKTSTDAQPVPLAENGFVARQSSGSSGDSANVYSMPRISTFKAGANTDWTAGTIIQTEDNIGISAFNNDSARYRKFVVGGSTVSEGVTNIPATAIVSSIGDNTDMNASFFGGYITSDVAFTPGTMEFRTAQFEVANTLSQSDYIYYTNTTSTEDATVFFIDDKFHIGTPTTNYSFPKTPGGTNQILQQDSNGELQFVIAAGLDATGTVTSVDTGTNLINGPITTTGTIGLSNALIDMNSITAVTDFDLNVQDAFTVNAPKGGAGVTTPIGKISSDGYAIFGGSQYTSSTRGSYTDTANLVYYEIEGSTTAGSPTVTVTAIRDGGTGVTKALTDLNTGYTMSSYFDGAAYVTSIDSGAGTITLNENSFETASFSYAQNINLNPAAVDTGTGLVVGLYSEYQVNANSTGSYNTLKQVDPLNIKYGYPESGFANTDFDIYAVGSSSVFSFVDDRAFTVARSSVTAANTALNAPNGITVGRNTDMSGRAENDRFPAFGLNILWDGIEPVSTSQQPGIVLKNYTQNTNQNFASFLASGANRLLFQSATGSINSDPYDTYPRTNQELGRLSFTGSTGQQLSPSSYNVPGFISVAAADDWDTWSSGTAGNTNVYMGATSTGINPDTYLSYKGGELFLGGGNSKSVTFAPAYNGSAQAPQVAYSGTPTIWANVNYANVSAPSGAKISVTNGGSLNAGTVGDMQLSLKRVDNSSTGSASPAGIRSAAYLGGSTNEIYIRFLPADAPPLQNYSTTMTGIVNGSDGVVSAFNGVQKHLLYTATGTYQGYEWFKIFDDSGYSTATTYTGLGGSAGYNLVNQSGADAPYVISSGVTGREYQFTVAEQSENLKLTTAGGTSSTQTDLLEVYSNAGNSYVGGHDIVSHATMSGAISGTYSLGIGTSTINPALGNFQSYTTSTLQPAGTITLDFNNFDQTFAASGINRTEGGAIYVIKMHNRTGNAQTIATTNTTNSALSDSLADGSSFVYRVTQIDDITIAEKIL